MSDSIKPQVDEIIKIFNDSSLDEKLEIQDRINNIDKVMKRYFEDYTYICSGCWKRFYFGEAEAKEETWTIYETGFYSNSRIPKTISGTRYYCPHCNKLQTEHYEKELIKRKDRGLTII